MNELTIKDLRSSIDEIFTNLDCSQGTKADYKMRIGQFLELAKKQGVSPNIFRQYKEQLAIRSDYSVSTKNKYLYSAKVLLKELNRLGRIPVDVTQNTKGFSQDKKHKRDGLNEDSG